MCATARAPQGDEVGLDGRFEEYRGNGAAGDAEDFPLEECSHERVQPAARCPYREEVVSLMANPDPELHSLGYAILPGEPVK